MEKEQSEEPVEDIPERPAVIVEEVDDWTGTDPDAKERVNEIKKEQKYLDYSKFSGNVADLKVTLDGSKSTETTNSPVSESETAAPYIIDEESFDEFSGYRAITFEVYSDGVILDDETEEELDADPELVFGKTAMDELERSPEGVVCVRDDTKKCDYRLERKDYPANGPINTLPLEPPEIDWGD